MRPDFRFRLYVLFGLLLAGWGCSSSPPPPAQDGVQYTSFDEVKDYLKEIAETGGGGGSSLMGLSESIEKLRATDAEKATALAAGVTQLENAPSPAARKQIATKMLNSM